jgi:hypothetical protein
MSDFQKASEVLKKSNDNNVNKYKYNNDSNVNGKYALDLKKFTPNTEVSVLAKEIAEDMNDLANFACYLDVVNKLGVQGAREHWRLIKNDILEKSKTKTPVRSPKKYFMYMLRMKGRK